MGDELRKGRRGEREVGWLNCKGFGGETLSDLAFTKFLLIVMLRIDSRR